jgi:hypothetical protein
MGINLSNRVPNHIKELNKRTYLTWTLDPVITAYILFGGQMYIMFNVVEISIKQK